eukprot:g6054.t1
MPGLRAAFLAVLAPAVLCVRGGDRPLFGWEERQAAIDRRAATGTLENSTECKGRMLAYEFGLKLQPKRAPQLEVFDALFADGKGGYSCNVTRPATASPAAAAARAAPSLTAPLPAHAWYVDAAAGSDAAAGTEAAPFKTVAKGIAASRAAAESLPADTPRAVVMRAGVHYLSAPIALGAQDSFLTLTNYDGEEAWVSGGIELQTKWQPYVPPGKPKLTCEQGCAAAGHCCVGLSSSFNNPSCAMGCWFANHSDVASQDACRAVCDQASAANCKFDFENASTNMCESCPTGCDAADGVGECYTGCRLAFGGDNVYVADLSQQMPAGANITGLFTLEPHERYIRARYPDADPENRATVRSLRQLHYIAPPILPQASQRFVNLTATVGKDDSTLWQYNVYANAVCERGPGDPECPCGAWEDVRADGTRVSESYWCSNATAGGWSNEDQGNGIYNGPALPTGLQYNTTDVAFSTFAEYADARGAIITSWRDQGWFVTMFEVEAHDRTKGEFRWSKGGFQGGRGYRINNTAGAPAAHRLDVNGGFFVENVFEELDAPREWYYNRTSRRLYVFYNDTKGGGPPAALRFVAPQLTELVGLRGTKAAPVRNVTIRGIGFRDAAYTYMHAHGIPSGGDWSLQRMGAVFLQGTEGVALRSNRFVRLDGNALMVSGYGRGLVVDDNEFAWLGDSAMASWGFTDTDTGSGLGGEQPRGTTVSNNYAHELGVWELQSSMWFQAKTAQTHLHGNIFFNGPRAGINFKHSGDHGPINSWDRQPFLTDVGPANAKQPSYSPAPTSIERNFVIANYGGSQAVDNDDGSSFYDIHDNFFFNAEGLKQDYGGHDSSY